MKVLVLHHIEPMWEASFHIPWEVYFHRIREEINKGSYDKVILTTLEGDEGYHDLQGLWDTLEQWSYAWEDPEEGLEWYQDCGIDIEDTIPSLGHEFTYLYQWIKDLKGHDVYLAGGANGECLQDLRDALDHLSIPHTSLYELIF